MRNINFSLKKIACLVFAAKFLDSAKYLKDLTPVFDELGWDAAYHCFREWEN